ncbi:HIT family protein [Bauldia sp.]|uniref:HIT family protein n=1 Tax=Bauldia sp. TaxID=2575872 RepID=UPI003BAC31FD
MTEDFETASRLVAESALIRALALSDLRLNADARFPWLILVPRRPDMAEIIDLEAADRATLFDEIVSVSAALRAATDCEKLNVAALGNTVRQLHVHVIARFSSDPAWPGPVWGVGEPIGYDPTDRDRLVTAILDALTD